jgi:hypothetical protein
MVYHCSVESIEPAGVRSNRVILAMFSDLAELWEVQESIGSITRYLIACYNYNKHTIIVGEKPYPDHIIPFIGASYSQCVNTKDTPTIEVIAQHFPYNPYATKCMRESWKLLGGGYMFLNAYYSKKPTNDVLLLQRVEHTVEFICNYCEFATAKYEHAGFTLVSIGSMAKYCIS